MDASFDFGKLLKLHQKKHKEKPSQFASVAVGVQKRLETNLKCRKSSRLTMFDNLRNISKCIDTPPKSNMQSKIEHRRQQLEKWKEEKERKKKEAAAMKKKPFLTGVPKKPLKYELPPPPPKPVPSTSGRVTRSQSAKVSAKPKETVKPKESKVASLSQSFAPKHAAFHPPEIKTLKKLPKLIPQPPKSKKGNKQMNITFDPVLPTTQKEHTKQTRSKTVKEPAVEHPVRKQADRTNKGKTTRSNAKTNTVKSSITSSSSSELEQKEASPILISKNLRKSLPTPSSPIVKPKTPRKSINVTPNKPVPKSESSSEERLRSPKSPDMVDNVVRTPQQIIEEARSPTVTVSRGKSNERNEMKKKRIEGLLDDDASNIREVAHFRRQLTSEIERMTGMCDTWDKISAQTVLPETVQEAVLSAVGQARLLMSQKLQQFSSLLHQCESPAPGSTLVTPADLHGFWEMVFLQVENIDIRFKKLEELRSQGWVESQAQPVEVKKPVVKPKVKKAPVKPAAGPSRLREMIAAARKAKKDQESQSVPPTAEAPPPEESKTFEAGFFSVRSPVRSPVPPRTPRSGNNSLLKAVLSSEANKASANKNTASFAMLRASLFGKNVECDGIGILPQTPVQVTPINLFATPGRSILKSSNTDNKSANKSFKTVLFDKSDTEIQDESYQPPKNEEKQNEVQYDSGLSSMDVENRENQENIKRKPKLVRQDAEDVSPTKTRRTRKSMNTTQEEVFTPRRSARKKVLQETEENKIEEVKPVRSSRRRKGTKAQD